MHQNNHKDFILLILLKMLLDFRVNNYLLIHYQEYTIFFVANFEFSLSEPFNKLTIFCVSIVHMIVTEFCNKLKVVSSHFSMMKNIVAPRVLKSLSIKQICCEYFNLVCLLKSIAINLLFFLK